MALQKTIYEPKRTKAGGILMKDMSGIYADGSAPSKPGLGRGPARGASLVRPGTAPDRYRVDTYRFGVLPEIATDLENREVVLVMDDGPYWFELRGISVRGVARRIDRAEPGETDALAWYVIEPRRILAWNYGAICGV